MVKLSPLFSVRHLLVLSLALNVSLMLSVIRARVKLEERLNVHTTKLQLTKVSPSTGDRETTDNGETIVNLDQWVAKSSLILSPSKHFPLLGNAIVLIYFIHHLDNRYSMLFKKEKSHSTKGVLVSVLFILDNCTIYKRYWQEAREKKKKPQ